MQPPILVPRRPTFVYPKFQKQLMDFRVPFVSGTQLVQPASESPLPACPRRGGVFPGWELDFDLLMDPKDAEDPPEAE